MPFVKAWKNFQGSVEGRFVKRGEEIEVDDKRHRALAKNGLVPPPEAKNATEPRNQMAPAPQNKMAAEPDNKNLTTDSLHRKKVLLDDPDAAKKLVEQHRPLSQASQAGGGTGAETAPSSSPPDHQPRPRRSRPHGEKHE